MEFSFSLFSPFCSYGCTNPLEEWSTEHVTSFNPCANKILSWIMIKTVLS